MPTLHHGHCILGYRGRFDAERAFTLLEKHGIRNTFLFPTALKMMMKAFPEPRERFRLDLRSMMSGGEPVGPAVFALGARGAWRHRERDLRADRDELHRRQLASRVAGEAGLDGTALPRPSHRGDRRRGPGGRGGRPWATSRVNRYWIDGTPDPVFFLEYWRNPQATASKFSGDWCRTGDEAFVDDDGYLWYQGRSDDMFKSAGYRIGPAEIENCLVKHPAVANSAVVPSPDETRGAIVKAFVLLAPGHAASEALESNPSAST